MSAERERPPAALSPQEVCESTGHEWAEAGGGARIADALGELASAQEVVAVEMRRADRLRREAEARCDLYREALIPFAFIGRGSMEPLGLVEEYDQARALLGLPPAQLTGGALTDAA